MFELLQIIKMHSIHPNVFFGSTLLILANIMTQFLWAMVTWMVSLQTLWQNLSRNIVFAWLDTSSAPKCAKEWQL